MTEKEYKDLKNLCGRAQVALDSLQRYVDNINHIISSSYYNQPDEPTSKVVPIDSELLFIKMIP